MAKRRSKNVDPSIKNPGKYLYPFDDYEKMTGEEFHRYKRHAQSFYIENTSTADLNTFVKKWMKTNKYKAPDIAYVVGNPRLLSVVSVLCKLRESGCPSFYEKENEYWQSLHGTIGFIRPIDEDIKKRIDDLLFNRKAEKVEKKVEAPKISVRDRMIEQLDPLISNIEGAIDDIYDKAIKLKDFDPYHMMITYEVQVKPAHAKIVKEHFARMFEEAKELNEKPDEQLKEGYSYLSAKQKRDLLKIYESIDNACDMLIQKGKTKRKVRKPKEKSKEKLVASVKFKDVDTDFNIASIHPVNIIGAKELWLFNTKYRKITHFIADEYEKELSIKGTTIQGFDKVKSETKTLRKPEEQLKEFSSAGKVALRKFMDQIKTKGSTPNGRINADTVILKAIS